MIRKFVDAGDRARPRRAVGRRLAHPRVPLRRRRRRGHRPRRRALRRRRAGQPRRRRRDRDPRARRDDRRRHRLRRARSAGTRRAATASRGGRSTRRGPRSLFGFGGDLAPRGARRTVAWYRRCAGEHARALRSAAGGFRHTVSTYGRRIGAAALEVPSTPRPGGARDPRRALASRSSGSCILGVRADRPAQWMALDQGGDQIWLVTTGWLLGDGELAPTYTGYGWPLGARAGHGGHWAELRVRDAGGDRVRRARARAARALGRLRPGGAPRRHRPRPVAAAGWVVAPFAVIPLWRDDYHERYVEQFLPGALGLTALADYQSMVLLLVAALLFVRGARQPRVDGARGGGPRRRVRGRHKALERPLPPRARGRRRAARAPARALLPFGGSRSRRRC